ncbi:caspase family protein [Nocardia cyriacigeorgica]|uniref:caspase family protein n=1 Tax=Nocardia cyriacigeorgica TaxID=135487 RepID=UPI0018934C60|nr:caspase family protein [Nocardia cyriacigeorgica]MBF6435500.1 caspase family protein [Nocardia cyriacigeorgica]MBF6454421.1 caspase family protein [Nocardia cyriacigeorgica]MBF6478087.1 caspase family protein [Nocardia cyriacigeorgica]MBF6552315.1 caspase family protein [Nocardia cyriacigeorgica]
MRKALIVGIDYYEHGACLQGCVNDALAVKSILERNADGTVNFLSPKVLTATRPEQAVTRQQLKESVQQLFIDDSEIALFYFAGHGTVESTGGYLIASDTARADDGLSLNDVMTFANGSRARNKIIILDSCHSGALGSKPLAQSTSELAEGVTILTASAEHQYSEEKNGSGVFTSLLVDALSGSAANLVGDITPGSVYAHIDQSLGPWEQRPVFKTNVDSFVSLRRAEAPIDLMHLHSLTTLFPTPDHHFSLDPTYEPERNSDQREAGIPEPDEENTRTFRVLQELVRVNLVRPLGAPHMWHAAMESKACELTVLGQHYWSLVRRGLI